MSKSSRKRIDRNKKSHVIYIRVPKSLHDRISDECGIHGMNQRLTEILERSFPAVEIVEVPAKWRRRQDTTTNRNKS